MKNNSKVLIKSYKLLHKSNPNKLNALFDLYQVYKKEVKSNVHTYWYLFLKNQINLYSNSLKFSHLGSTKHISTQLNSSYLQICLNESCSILNKYLSSIELKFNEILNKSSIKDKDLLHQLRTINSNHAWLFNNANTKSINENNEDLGFYYPFQTITDDYGNLIITKHKVKTLISKEAFNLSKLIFKQIIKRRVKFPKLNKPRLILDSRVMEITESKIKTFDYWLNISTLSKGKKILIPVKSNDFFEHAPGFLGKTIELDFKQFDYEINEHKYNSLNKSHNKIQSTNKTMDIIVNKKNEINSEFIDKSLLTQTISFDLGLCNFLATNNGELYGKYWLNKLKTYDEKITTLFSDRQYIFRNSKDKKNKIRSKKYDNLIAQVKGFIKTEINRILNHYFETNKNIKTVVIESLNFDKPELSKKLNRIIKNFGLKLFKEKLKELSLLKGFKIEELNPAYSSQECNSCHYVDERNRKTQSKFKCLCCGIEINADINGGRVNLKRFESKQNSTYKSKYKGIILGEIKNSFINGIKALLSNGIIGRRRLYQILLENKYFKDVNVKDLLLNNILYNYKELVRTTKASGIKPMTANNYKLI